MVQVYNKIRELTTAMENNTRRVIAFMVLAFVLITVICIMFVPPPYDPLTDDTEYFLELTIYRSGREPVDDYLELTLWLFNATAADSPGCAIVDGHYYENISMDHSLYMWNAWSNATFTYAEWQHISTWQVDDDGWGWSWTWDVDKMDFIFGPDGYASYEWDNGFHTVKWELWEPMEVE